MTAPPDPTVAHSHSIEQHHHHDPGHGTHRLADRTIERAIGRLADQGAIPLVSCAVNSQGKS
jgi:hypothetical protein